METTDATKTKTGSSSSDSSDSSDSEDSDNGEIESSLRVDCFSSLILPPPPFLFVQQGWFPRSRRS